VVLVCFLVLAACSQDQAGSLAAGTRASLRVTSPAFQDRGQVPVDHTCDGAETSPPLAWSGDAGDGLVWALVVDDPDAPDTTYVHWVVLDIPLSEHDVDGGMVPAGGVEVENSSGGTSYVGPCPPEGRHRYRFTVYALAEPAGLPEAAPLDEALGLIGDLSVARGTLLGTYER
jgi:Raf kinase inhibitor-like YbhB/YbcL family protein